MGALVAFELARELHRLNLPAPARLFPSGPRAPHLPPRRNPVHHFSDREFRAELRRLQGPPAAAVDNDELMDLVLPCLRADFELSETYARDPDGLFDTPIRVFGGEGDDDATPEELAGWSLHTRRFGGVTLFPGDHFFLFNHAKELLNLMHRELEYPQ